MRKFFPFLSHYSKFGQFMGRKSYHLSPWPVTNRNTYEDEKINLFSPWSQNTEGQCKMGKVTTAIPKASWKLKEGPFLVSCNPNLVQNYFKYVKDVCYIFICNSHIQIWVLELPKISNTSTVLFKAQGLITLGRHLSDFSLQPLPDNYQSLSFSVSVTHIQREERREGEGRWERGRVGGRERSTFLILFTTTKLNFKAIFQDCKSKYL